MQKFSVLVLGHKFADPGMWLTYLTRRFGTCKTFRENLHKPDGCNFFDHCSAVEVEANRYVILTKAPIYDLLDEEKSYRLLLKQQADIIIYFQSIFADMLYLIKRNFELVNGLLGELPQHPPVFTLLNDIYGGKSHPLLSTEELTKYEKKHALLPDEDLKKYRISGSRVFRTAIGYLPASGDCSVGADNVFDELLTVLDDMKA